MNTVSTEITKEDIKLISLGLSEYINNVEINKTIEEKDDIDYMMSRLNKYLKENQ
jgi:hypothetical protein